MWQDQAHFHLLLQKKDFVQQQGLPRQEGSYSYSVQRTHALPLDMQSRQAIPFPLLYDQYEVKTHVEGSRRDLEPQHVQHASLPHHADSYYLAAAHEPYLPENLSHHGAYRRHRVTLTGEMVPSDQVVLYGREYDMPQLSKERERERYIYIYILLCIPIMWPNLIVESCPPLQPHMLCSTHIL